MIKAKVKIKAAIKQAHYEAIDRKNSNIFHFVDLKFLIVDNTFLKR